MNGDFLGRTRRACACACAGTVLSAALLAGCAADPQMADAGNQNGSRSGTQLIPVTSDPAGAEVTVNGVRMAVTPGNVDVERAREDNVLTFSKPGYESQTVRLIRMQNENSGGANFGLIGGLADASTGNMYKQMPERVNITLHPVQHPPATPGTGTGGAAAGRATGRVRVPATTPALVPVP